MPCSRKDTTCTDLIRNEIKELVEDVFESTTFEVAQVCFAKRANLNDQDIGQCLQSYGHEQYIEGHSRTYSCNIHHFLNDQDIVGKAFATNQPWFSTDVSSIPDMDCRGFKILNLNSAIAIPLRVVNTCDIPTCRIPDKYVFEFFLFNGEDFEKQKKQIYKLISTLREFEDNNTDLEGLDVDYLPSFQLVLQPINLVGQNGASDSLFPKENPLEASDAKFLPEPRYQTEQCLDPIPSTQPAEVETRYQDTKPNNARETNEERHSTGDTIINVPDTSLKGAAKSTTVFQSLLQQIQDFLFKKENPSETSDGRLLPEPSYPNAKCLETTPRTEPAEVRGDNISQGDFLSLAVGGTSEERHATGEKTINTVPGSSLKDETSEERHATAINTVPGKTTRSAGSKRDWAWKYCSPIEGNSNGVICSFCGLEIKGGGITRFKSHLSDSDTSKNVKKCEKVPSDVKVETEKRIKRA